MRASGAVMEVTHPVVAQRYGLAISDSGENNKLHVECSHIVGTSCKLSIRHGAGWTLPNVLCYVTST